jgi:oxygen-independent coproporphyrinogen-3 oxidase
MRTVRRRKPENFLTAIARAGSGLAEEAALLPREGADEALVMGLRLREGVDTAAIARRFGLEAAVDFGRVDRLMRSGHMTRQGSRIALTAAGRLLLDHILGEIALAEPIAASAGPARQPESVPVAH